MGKELLLAFLPRRILAPLWNKLIIGPDGKRYQRLRYIQTLFFFVLLLVFGDIWEFIQICAALVVGFASMIIIFNMNQYNFIKFSDYTFHFATFFARENRNVLN